MRHARLAALAAFVLPWLGVGTARAELPRDYLLDPPAAGTFALLDAYTIGLQASLENRTHLEEGMSMLTTRVSGIMSYPYADGSFNLDARVFLFTLGGSVGYRQTYRNLTFAPNASYAERSREGRRAREADKDFDSQGFGYYEGRLRLTVPLEDFFMVNTGTVRVEDREDNSFDWLHGNVHDGGTLYKLDSTLFYRHRRFGVIGPYFRYMNSPKTRPDGSHAREDEFHLGLALGTRPGLVKARGRDADLLLLQLIFRVDDRHQEYGLHGYQGKVPLFPLLVYRTQLSLL